LLAGKLLQVASKVNSHSGPNRAKYKKKFVSTVATVIGHERSHAQDRADYRAAFTPAHAIDPFNANGTQVAFNGSKTIDEIGVYTVQDNAETPTETIANTTTFSLHGVTDFDVQYWNADTSAWATVPGGNVTGNTKVWKKITFAAITTSKIRVTVNNALNNRTRVVEVEAFTSVAPSPRSNVALAGNGGTVSYSTQESPYVGSFANDGEHLGYVSGQYTFWRDNTNASFPDWLQIDFNSSKSIDEIDIFTVQDSAETPTEPVANGTTFSLHGITDFEVQFWNGTAWATISGGNVTGNTKVWKKLTFAAVTTTKIRVTVNNALNNRSRIVEVEAWTATTGGPSANVKWLVSDQLGTPRMIFDQTGSLARVSRHDYLPFGEELYAGTGGRTTAQGYGGDNVRQKFTSKERDVETGLDYFGARYYGSAQGRFTSPDDFLNDTHPGDPQTWNLYGYVRNNPLRYIDPDGRLKKDADGNIIFEKTGEDTVTFIKKKPLKDGDGNIIKDKNGKALTVTVSWKVETGNVLADDGTKIEAQRATGEMQVVVKDGSGNVVKEESTKQQDRMKASGYDNSTDCHGTTFAKGQVWINNNQVEKIIKGDHYVQTSSPGVGDVGIYTTNGNLSETQHSVLVNSVDAKGVVDVTSKGGITPRVNIAPGPGVGTAWKDQNAKLQYFTQRVSQPKR
jgi:RHS repeat-associated protein